MKAKIYLLAVLLMVQSLASSAEQPTTVTQRAKTALQKLKEQCDNPRVSNESYWTSYASNTELLRRQSIRDLKPLGEVGLAAVRRESASAKGEYRQMLSVVLAALGDKEAVPQTVKLMLQANRPAVRFVAAAELGGLKNKQLIDPFKRRDGSCVEPRIIYPVRLVASGALTDLGLTLEEVRKIGVWWYSPSSPAAQSLRFDLTLDRGTYEVGEPIELALRLTNMGDAAVSVPVSSEFTGRNDGYSFVVRDEDGQVLKDPGREHISGLKSISSFRSVRPMEAYTRKLLLNYRVPLLKPGTYTVSGVYQPRRSPQHVVAESPDVVFVVVDTPATAIGNRISRLAQELRKGGDADRIARSLGFTGDGRAIAPLINLLYASDDGTRLASVEALMYLDLNRVRKALLAALEKRGPRDRLVELLVGLLGEHRKQVVPVLLRWLQDRNGDVRDAAVKGLYLANRDEDPKLLPHLVAMLRDPLPRVRLRATSAVGVYGSAAGLKALKSVLGDSDPQVRQQAVTAVGWVATSATAGKSTHAEAIDTLLNKLQSGGEPARRAAYWLGKAGDKRAVGSMKKVMEFTKDQHLRKELQQALNELAA